MNETSRNYTVTTFSLLSSDQISCLNRQSATIIPSPTPPKTNQGIPSSWNITISTSTAGIAAGVTPGCLTGITTGIATVASTSVGIGIAPGILILSIPIYLYSSTIITTIAAIPHLIGALAPHRIIRPEK